MDDPETSTTDPESFVSALETRDGDVSRQSSFYDPKSCSKDFKSKTMETGAHIRSIHEGKSSSLHGSFPEQQAISDGSLSSSSSSSLSSVTGAMMDTQGKCDVTNDRDEHDSLVQNQCGNIDTDVEGRERASENDSSCDNTHGKALEDGSMRDVSAYEHEETNETARHSEDKGDSGNVTVEEDANSSSATPSKSTPKQPSHSKECGASLFSIPPTTNPRSGIYDLPIEAFEMRDLDSGRTFHLDKRYWIKDVDTGRVYVMQPESHDSKYESPTATGSNSLSGSNRSSCSPLKDQVLERDLRFSDLMTGRELSLMEFEQSLGYFDSRNRITRKDHSNSSEENAGKHHGISSLSHAAQSGASWVKRKAAAAFDRVSSPQGGNRRLALPSSKYTGGPLAPNDSKHPYGSSSIGSYHSISSLDGNGIPVKVSVNRKKYKELTDLRLVQRLPAHEGVIWAAKFSRSGKYLATAGQDCVVQVWEVITNRNSSQSLGQNSNTPMESPRTGDSSLTGGSFEPSQQGNHKQAQALDYGVSKLSIGPTDVKLDAGSPSYQKMTSFGSNISWTSRNEGSDAQSPTYGIPVIQNKPIRRYLGHKADVLELAWSKTNFLLSASMDRTVRLWHASVEDCLRVFKHSDFVTSIDFHPLDDKLFLSGSIDGRVRLWNVPDQKVVAWQDVHDMVTAVGVSKDGKRAVVGSMRGKCRFYGAGGATLEYEAQLDVKNKRGQHSRGKKITGVIFAPPNASPNKRQSSFQLESPDVNSRQRGTGISPSSHRFGPPPLLVTSNDSRIRLYDGFTLKSKYKGHQNRSTQIKASFSPRGDYIICGSDDGSVYVWNTRKSLIPGFPNWGHASSNDVPDMSSSTNNFQRQTYYEAISKQVSGVVNKEKNSSFESFQVASDVVTVALFAPECTHRRLDAPQSPTSEKKDDVPDSSGEDQTSGSAGLRGQIIIAAGYNGEIRIYENIGLPQWL